ncbi:MULTISPECIES: hypothetical protein [unclassified Moorena]|uniref:hypothetical protein n=1 Tax=unclassified Moorena TaxID=2683338 RepID=UPI0013B6DFC9|nr:MULTISPECIES: hypothetical protein [unclassified Moorena]NEO14483.1 hypothetical protein [Moorena sp. SIO3E8]NEO38811.1 hypothetical protein [Moorena sp. SIOASIH]
MSRSQGSNQNYFSELDVVAVMFFSSFVLGFIPINIAFNQNLPVNEDFVNPTEVELWGVELSPGLKHGGSPLT